VKKQLKLGTWYTLREKRKRQKKDDVGSDSEIES